MLNLGAATSLKASITQQRQLWDRWLGHTETERRNQTVEINTAFGHNRTSGLRLAMATLQLAEGKSRTQQSTREAHLNLAPTSRLRLNADYTMGDQGSSTQTAQTIGAALKLTPDTELTAKMSALDASAEGRMRQLAVALTAKIAGGQLAAERKTTLGLAGLTTSRKLAFAGALGQTTPTNVKMDFQESRGDRPDAPLARKAFIYVDRRFARWLTVSVERHEVASGQTTAPEVSTETRYEAIARFGKRMELTSGFVVGRQGAETRGERHMVLSHSWQRLRLRAETRDWQAGADHRSSRSCAVEIPTGELPEWAKTIWTAHEFVDAQEYTLGRQSALGVLPGEMSFTGYRLWAACRSGSGETGGFGFSHRRVAGRYQLQLWFEERPDAPQPPSSTLFYEKGAILPLRRRSVEIGARLTDALNLRCGLRLHAGLNSTEDSIAQARLGLWGKLRDGGQVEADVWQESGRWAQAAIERTSLTMLYSRRVSDDDRIEVKLGYAWGAGGGGDCNRDCRFALTFKMPM